MSKEQALQDVFLNELCKSHDAVNVYLVNGIRLQGKIEAFDRFVIMLRDSVTRMIYKHAISTIAPLRQVSLPFGNEDKASPAAKPASPSRQ